jgi:hypothetical protein
MAFSEAIIKAHNLGAIYYSVFSIKHYFLDLYTPFSYAFYNENVKDNMREEVAHYIVSMDYFCALTRWNGVDLEYKKDGIYLSSGIKRIEYV